MPTPTLTAPLREAHAHLHMLGRSLTMLSLADCTSLDECLHRVRAEASRLDTTQPRDHWLLACSMRVEGWREPRWPTRDDLDRVCPARPAALMSFDHHSVAANTPAMHAAGLHDNSPDPEKGVIVRDGRGTPTGVLLEAAAKRVWSSAPEPAPTERPALVRAALAHLYEHGFREVHDLLSPPWLGPLLAGLSDRRELPLSVGLYPLLPDLPEQVDAAARYARSDVTLMGGKVFADGTLNSRTAWMLEPYADADTAHPRGLPLMHEPALRAAIEQTRSLGVGLSVHAIGDAAVRATLDAWEPVGARTPRTHGSVARCNNGAPSLRIDHLAVLDTQRGDRQS